MTTGLIQILGGLGLFLFGMAVMTDALRALADDRLRGLLARTVTNPWKGAVTGALSTTVLQSSSATTVAAVSFVGAGLLTFSESLGIIFGANIGTTLKGWMVALVGFKFDLGGMMMPLILVGVLLRLFGSKRLEQIGMSIAGFALIFVGITALQQGLTGLEGRVTPEQFPPDTLAGRLLLVLIGLIITLLTQSSSAGVAMALAAVHTHTITLNQAAAMVIGMDVGTTATAALATIGGNVHARRTGFAHVIYNSMTGVMAFGLLTPYMLAVEATLPGARDSDPELVLVGFHTFFNTVGVIAVLPFTSQFARLIMRIIPERGNPLTRQLDRSQLATPPLAIAAVQGTLWQITHALLQELRRPLHDPLSGCHSRTLDQISDAVGQTNEFMESLATRHEAAADMGDYLASLHVLDHLRRIEARVREENRLRRCRDDAGLIRMTEQLQSAVDLMLQSEHPVPPEHVERIHSTNYELKGAMREYRRHVIEQAAQGQLTTAEVLRRMDTARTLRRLGHHLWRIADYLAAEAPATAAAGPETN